MRRLGALLLACLVGACSSGGEVVPATEVLVIVDATPAVRVRTASLQVQISSSASADGPFGNTVVEAFGPPAAMVAFPRRFGLVPRNHDATRFFEVRASALAADFSPVASTVVRSGYLLHRTLELHIVLDDACAGVTCPMDETCRHGACHPIFVDPGMLPDVDGGENDAGVDLGPPDASDGGTDAPAPDAGCHNDRDCSDHEACNGDEKCVEGSCAPGTPRSCDDGVSCTDDSCDTTAGCVHTPNDAHCTASSGGHCDALMDCQYATCSSAFCAPDPASCTTAACVGATCTRTLTCAAGEACCSGHCGAVGCDDGNPCTDDSCGASGCAHTNNTAACSDGNVCTAGDVCHTGTCHPGGLATCDDGRPCTHDFCTPMTGCGHTNDDTLPCDDLDGCTSLDHCAGGSCIGTSVGSCDDGNPCTIDSCDGTGGCSNVAGNEGSSCIDRTSCTFDGVCSGGGCVGLDCAAGLHCCPSSGVCIDDSMVMTCF